MIALHAGEGSGFVVGNLPAFERIGGEQLADRVLEPGGMLIGFGERKMQVDTV